MLSAVDGVPAVTLNSVTRHKADHRYRRAPHLMIFWSARGVEAANVADGRSVAVTPFVLQLLEDCSRPQTAERLATRHDVSVSKLRRTLRRMVAIGLLRNGDPSAARRDRQCSLWNDWNPSATFFHRSTRDVPFRSMEEGARYVRSKMKRHPRPPSIKRVRGPVVPLNPPDTRGEFSSVLLERRTWRAFSGAPLSLSALSTLLNFTAGIQRWARTQDGRVALKTSPSGGARHPIETYVAALDCERVRPALYHYSADRHVLTRVDSIDRAEIRSLIPQQPWYSAAGLIVFFTAVVARTMWRYPYARAYRALLVEVGHVCQTFCLTATWLGLAPFCTLALADSAIERKLRIDGSREIVLYAAGAGSRPHGVSWAPWPDNRPHRFQPHILGQRS
jgi:SagB-type dehydrogenase family enzyme